MKVLSLIAVSTLLLTMFVAAIHPQTGFAAEDDVAAKAREQYTKGKSLYEQKKYPEALDSFQAAYETKPHPTVLKSIAECQIQLGDLPAAVETLERFLAARGSKGHKAIRKRIRKLKSQIGTVEIFSAPTGAGLEINGIATTDLTPATIKLAAGDYKITVNAEGYEPLVRDLTVVGGRLATLKTDFTTEGTPLPEPEPEPIVPAVEEEPTVPTEAATSDSGRLKTGAAFWVMTGLAAAGTINGAVFGSLTLKKEGDYKENPTDKTKDQGELYGIIADVSFGVAIASAIAGTIILIVRNTGEETLDTSVAADDTRFQLLPIASNEAIGLGASLSF